MLKLRCFGQVVVIDGSGKEHTLRSRKHLGLLVYLLAHHRTTHPREDLADLLWGGSGSKARHSLSQALYDIRSNVGDLVKVSSTSVRLYPGRIDYEAGQFEEAVENGDHETALELYRGDFAPDLMGLGVETFDRWVDGERERCRVLASLALRNAQRAAEERGDWDRMCLASLRLARMNEFDEEAHTALMRGLWMKGDPASALRHFRSLSDDLTAGWKSAHALVERLENSGSVREVLTVPRRPVELLGRGGSFNRLREIARERGGVGAIVGIVGAAGIGKTSFTREFARLVSVQGWRVERTQSLTAVDPDGRVPQPSLALVDGGWETVDWGEFDRVPGRLVLVTCQNAKDVEKALALGRLDEVVVLPRLTIEDSRRVVARECRKASWSLTTTLARLSGGNPRLAVEVGRALSGSRGSLGLPNTPAIEAGRVVLAHSEPLRLLVRNWFNGLSKPAQSLATTLAVLSVESCHAWYQLGFSPTEQEALSELEAEGWLVRTDVGIGLALPLVRCAISGWTSIRDRTRIREVFAAAVADSSARGRYLAAQELAEAGHDRRAFEESVRSVDEASSDGDLELASRAGALALAKASDLKDRFRSALALARAELGRGRPGEAEVVVRGVRHFAEDDSERLEAQLLLLRSLIASDNHDLVVRESRIASDLAARAGDRRLNAITAVTVAEAQLTAAMPTNRHRDLVEAADSLESALHASREFAELSPVPWQTSFRTLFMYRTISTSRTSAEVLLRRYAPVLYRTNDRQGRHMADLGRAVVEIRAARLQTALPMVEGLVAAAPSSSRSRAVTLNNLAVVLTELGDFVSARRVLSEVGSLDKELRPAEAEQLSTLLNHAQAAWFMGDHEAVTGLAEQALSRAAVHDEPHLEAEAAALLGLSAWDLRETDTVERMAERVSAFEPWTSRIQDRYLVSWFRAVARSAAGHDPAEDLWDAAIAVDDTDCLAAAKLRVVASHFACRGPEQEQERDRAVRLLRRNGAGWFVRRASAQGR